GMPATDSAGGWSNSIQLEPSFGSNFLLRALVARQAIGALEAREAIYPRCKTDAEGELLHGNFRYRLRFPPGQLPPVDAFWSITLYDSERILLVDKPIILYSLGDRTPGLLRDLDGGLTLILQHEQPQDPAELANWLPTPQNGFSLCLRAY